MLLLSLLACAPDFTTPDDACKSPPPGHAKGSDVSVDLIDRMNCYRRLAGMSRGNIVGAVQDAVSSHAGYLSANAVDLTTSDGNVEDPGLSGFTGADVFTRLDAAGMDVTTADTFVWFYFYGPWSGDPAGAVEPDGGWATVVDAWMDDPNLRQVVLHPGWRGGAAALSDGYFYLNVVGEWPPNQHTFHPVVYPADRQEDVPTTFRVPDYGGIEQSYWGVGPGDYGYPISFTIGTASAIGWTSANPASVQVLEAHLTDDSGDDVPVTVVVPHDNPDGTTLLLTAFLVPNAPLQPSTTYTVDATLAWVNVDKNKVETTFTTADE